MILRAGLALAYAAFALTFRGPRREFWQRMTLTGIVLGDMAIANDVALRRPRLRQRDMALGLFAAAGLYGIFRIGDRFARRFMPRGEQQIDDIYALRTAAPEREIALRLATVIGPAEELFWRGFVLRRVGTLRAAAAYGGAHLVTGNPTLVGAASLAGLYWSVLRTLGMPMAALITSHVVWDLWIFLVAPTAQTDGDGDRDPPG